MPLNVRENAITVAVFCFFAVAIIASASGNEPYVCCKRALIAAALGYFGASLALKAVNAIAMQALITKKIEQQKRESYEQNQE